MSSFNLRAHTLYSGSGRILVSRRVEGTLLAKVRLVMNLEDLECWAFDDVSKEQLRKKCQRSMGH